jgi:hypothetical protein
MHEARARAVAAAASWTGWLPVGRVGSLVVLTSLAAYSSTKLNHQSLVWSMCRWQLSFSRCHMSHGVNATVLIVLCNVLIMRQIPVTLL